MQVNKINWFPGHMKKAIDQMKSIINNVDFVIEVLDARGIEITSNDELKKIFLNKPIIKIALKKDLSDILKTNNDILLTDVKNNKNRNLIIEKLNLLFNEKIQRLKLKGLINPEFVGIVIGLPNIGKSSLINFLSTKNTLKVENRSGVTKKQSLKKINNNFYLIDTPGVFFKNVDNIEDGYKLCILNCINKNVVPMYDVLSYIYNYFLENYNSKINTYFGIESNLSFDEFINYICKKYKFINNQNEYDLERFYNFIFNEFSNSNICKFHFK